MRFNEITEIETFDKFDFLDSFDKLKAIKSFQGKLLKELNYTIDDLNVEIRWFIEIKDNIVFDEVENKQMKLNEKDLQNKVFVQKLTKLHLSKLKQMMSNTKFESTVQLIELSSIPFISISFKIGYNRFLPNFE